MITVTIDGKQTEVAPETFILEAAKQVDVHIPALCDSEMVEPYGACRVCSVEIDDGGRRKIVTACNYPIRKIEVFTASERAARTRKNVFEMMLARWPGVKIVRDMAKHAGVDEPRFTHPQRNETPNACILCGLCVRMCREGVWHNVLAFEGRGTSRRVVMPETERSNECRLRCLRRGLPHRRHHRWSDDPNNPVDPKRIRRAGMVLTRELILFDDEQAGCGPPERATCSRSWTTTTCCRCTTSSSAPTPNAKQIHSPSLEKNYWDNRIFDGCYHGCDMACAKVVPDHRGADRAEQGPAGLVDGPEYETLGGSTNIGVFDPEWIFEMNYYCDDYGIDTISSAPSPPSVWSASRRACSTPTRPAGSSCGSATPRRPRATAPDGPRRRLRPGRRPGHPPDEEDLCRGVRRRPRLPPATSAWRTRGWSTRST